VEDHTGVGDRQRVVLHVGEPDAVLAALVFDLLELAGDHARRGDVRLEDLLGPHVEAAVGRGGPLADVGLLATGRDEGAHVGSVRRSDEAVVDVGLVRTSDGALRPFDDGSGDDEFAGVAIELVHRDGGTVGLDRVSGGDGDAGEKSGRDADGEGDLGLGEVHGHAFLDRGAA
jgi:hypothetical protein